MLRVPFFEPLDTTSGVYELLLTREERVAVRADFDLDLRLRRSRLKRVAARARDDGTLIRWMYTCFHCLLRDYFYTIRGGKYNGRIDLRATAWPWKPIDSRLAAG